MKTRYDDLVKVLSWYGGRLQKSIMGEKCLLVLYGAEHLDEKGAALVRKYDVVLVANLQTKSLKAAFGDRTLWANRLTWQEMKRSLEILHPGALSAQVKIATQLAGGDLRQAQIHTTSGTTVSTEQSMSTLMCKALSAKVSAKNLIGVAEGGHQKTTCLSISPSKNMQPSAKAS